MVVWWGTRTECISALMRQVREGSLAPTDERAARHVLHTLMQTWAEMQPSEALRSTGRAVTSCSSVAGSGCIATSAAAILWCQGLTTGQGFVSFDQRLSDVGYREGFTVLPEAF